MGSGNLQFGTQIPPAFFDARIYRISASDTAEMVEQKTIVAATATIFEGQLAVLVQFSDGDWTLWTADSKADVEEIISLVGRTVEIDSELEIMGTVH